MKKLLLLSLLLVAVGTVCAASDWVRDVWDGPLEPGAIGAGIKAGPVFSRWYDKEKELFTINNQDCTSEGCTIITGQNPTKFNDMFGGASFWLSGEISYNVTQSIKLFGEVAWRRASGQNENKVPPKEYELDKLGNFQIRQRFDTFHSIGGYAGVRYYIGTWLDCIEPYFGFKLGLLNHSDICQELIIKTIDQEKKPSKICEEECKDPKLQQATYFNNNVVSGGPVFGFTYDLWGCVFFHMSVEVIASGCMKANREIPFKVTPPPPVNENNDGNDGTVKTTQQNNIEITNISMGTIGTDFAVPVTFGLVFQY